MELKTLKDIKGCVMSEEDLYAFGKGKFFAEFVHKRQLKAEAIKWVKEDIQNASVGASAWKLIEDWKERLNITEEDLGEKK